MGKTKHTEPKQYLSITEAAEFLGVSRPTIYWKTRARVTPRAEEALTPDNFYN